MVQYPATEEEPLAWQIQAEVRRDFCKESDHHWLEALNAYSGKLQDKSVFMGKFQSHCQNRAERLYYIIL